MASFGIKSRDILHTCDDRLQEILREAIKVIDFSVLEGYRSTETQQKYYKDGKSKLDGIIKRSKHQSYPSKAVDIAPYPIDFGDKEKARARFYHLMGVIKAISYQKGIPIRFGMDWDGDDNFEDQSFDDLPHLELA